MFFSKLHVLLDCHYVINISNTFKKSMEATDEEMLNKSSGLLSPGLGNQTTDYYMGWGVNFSTTSESFANMGDNKTMAEAEEFIMTADQIAASIVCVVGFLANTAAIVTFVVQRKLKIPYYTAVFCSSIADLTALIARYLLFFIDVIHIERITRYHMFGISCFTHLSSNFHVLIIAVIRYIYVSKPFYSLTFQYSKVLLMSFGVWLTSLFIAALYRVLLYLLQEEVISWQFSPFVEMSMIAVPFFVALIPIVILHILNIKNLRKGLSTSTTAVSKTMSTVLAAIIIIFLISNIPSILINVLVLCNVDINVGWYMQIFWMVSCSTNPFVFFLCSKSTKTVLVNVFTCKRLRK